MQQGTQDIEGKKTADVLSVSEYRAILAKPKKKSKYRNVRTERHGIKFDSKRQAAYYDELLLRQKAGEICCIECEPIYDLRVNGDLICKYIPDFRYLTVTLPIETVIVDVKSKVTRLNRAYILKRKLMKACHNIEVVEVF